MTCNNDAQPAARETFFAASIFKCSLARLTIEGPRPPNSSNTSWNLNVALYAVSTIATMMVNVIVAGDGVED